MLQYGKKTYTKFMKTLWEFRNSFEPPFIEKIIIKHKVYRQLEHIILSHQVLRDDNIIIERNLETGEMTIKIFGILIEEGE